MAPVRKSTKSLRSQGHKAFRALLVEARNNAALSQVDVAKGLGKPQSFVSKYESGERRLDVIEFIEVARVLGADPVALLRALVRK